MAETTGTESTVARTERGLTVAGTRITLYSIMDLIAAGWPQKLIRDRLSLTDQQIVDVLTYITEHQEEVENEYREVLREAEESRRFWEEHNSERFKKIGTLQLRPHQVELSSKLQAHKMKLDQRDHSSG